MITDDCVNNIYGGINNDVLDTLGEFEYAQLNRVDYKKLSVGRTLYNNRNQLSKEIFAVLFATTNKKILKITTTASEGWSLGLTIKKPNINMIYIFDPKIRNELDDLTRYLTKAYNKIVFCNDKRARLTFGMTDDLSLNTKMTVIAPGCKMITIIDDINKLIQYDNYLLVASIIPHINFYNVNSESRIAKVVFTIRNITLIKK